MSIPVESLTENDYRILKYINKFSSVSEQQIVKHFNCKIGVVKYRLSVLSEPDFEYRASRRLPIDNSSYIASEFDVIDTDAGKSYKRNGRYHISPLGQTALQDHLVQKKADRSSFLRRNVLTPIIVAAVTDLIIHGLRLLLPLIIQWLTNSL